jgi:cytoskeletal protein CcmA (bactofilin family)
MQRVKKLIWVNLLVLLLLAVTAAPVFASGPMDGRIIFGDSFTLESGEVIEGDLVVLGGSVTLEEGSRVEGDVAVMGGSADVSGNVEGDLVVFGGSVDLKSGAVVEGQLVAFGGNIDRAEGAIVRGNEVEGFSFDNGFDLPVPGIARVWSSDSPYDWDHWLLRAFFRAVKVLMSVLLVVAIGALAAVFMPRSLERVGQAVLVAPVNSWLVGFVTAILALLVGGVLIATLCLSPFGGILWLALLVGGVFGWAALGLVVGLRVLERLNVQSVTPVMAVVAGSAILSFIAAALWIVAECCLGWPFVVVVGAFGLGAVVLTRFGTREYVPGAEAPPAPQPPVQAGEIEGEYALSEPEAAQTPDESTPEADEAAGEGEESSES